MAITHLGAAVFLEEDPDTGEPLAGGKAYFYEVGTTTPKTTWADRAKAAANPHPVILDASGRAKIFIDGDYTIELHKSDDTLIYTSDVVGIVDLSVLAETYETKAELEAASVDADTVSVDILGLTASDDGGGGRYDRVSSEPSHEGKIRSTDRFLPDGTTDANFGGWWELQPVESVVRARQLGAVGDGTTSDTTAVANARTMAGVNDPILLDNGDFDANATTSPYGSEFRDALGLQWLLGTAAAPATRHEPIVWAEKVSASTRDTIATAWDQGAFYGSLEKTAGDAFGAALTAYAKYTGGTGDLVAGHHKTLIEASGGRGFATRSVAEVTTATPDRVIGHEIDVDNTGADPGWNSGTATGDISGLVVAMQDGTFAGTHGIRLPDRADGDNQRWWTGIQFGRNSIMPSSGGDGEAIRIRGGADAAQRYGGIAFGDGTGVHELDYAIRTVHATLGDSAALWLADNHRIIWGADKASTRYVSADTATALFNCQNYSLAVNGTKVVGTRKTAWGAPLGTATRTSFSTTTVTLEELAERLKALVDDLTTHGLIGA